jgi:hypothetical protein
MMKERRKRIGNKREFFLKNGYPKVLVVAPIYEHKYYCINDYFTNLRNLEYPESKMDFLFVDNSQDMGAHRLLQELNPKMPIVYHGEGYSTRERQANAYNHLRDKFLDGDYEYLFIVESDLFPHESMLKDLMVNDVDIVGAPYYLNLHKSPEHIIPCVTTGKFKTLGGVMQETFASFQDLDGELKQIGGGIGFGCILLKREVLEKVVFTHDRCHADTYFHRDCHRAGFKTWLDTRFTVPHYSSEYPENF